jgi:hypothetical protein
MESPSKLKKKMEKVKGFLKSSPTRNEDVVDKMGNVLISAPAKISVATQVESDLQQEEDITPEPPKK